jgi:hypothetical protein
MYTFFHPIIFLSLPTIFDVIDIKPMVHIVENIIIIIIPQRVVKTQFHQRPDSKTIEKLYSLPVQNIVTARIRRIVPARLTQCYSI